MSMGIYAIKNKVNGKLYIGQSIHIEERWKQHIAELNCNSHCNYKIQNEWETYGRHSFEFSILEKIDVDYNYSKKKLRVVLLARENYYISKFNSIKNGYNIEDTLVNILKKENTAFSNEFCDFIANEIHFNDFLLSENPPETQIKEYISNNCENSCNESRETSIGYFYRVPKDYSDCREIMVKFCLDRHRTMEGETYVSLQQICQDCNHSTDRHKGNFLDFVKKTLSSLVERGLITQCCGTPLDKAGVKELLGFVLSDEFSPCSNYISLSANAFDKIVKIKTSIKREVLLNAYLYVKSFIYDYQPNSNDTYTPYGFYGNLLLACDELGYTRKTIDACMDLFVSCGIFKCHLTGSYKKANGTVANAPNIYVLNDENADKNIRLLLEKMQTQYKVDEFMQQVYKGNSLRAENKKK